MYNIFCIQNVSINQNIFDIIYRLLSACFLSHKNAQRPQSTVWWLSMYDKFGFSNCKSHQYFNHQMNIVSFCMSNYHLPVAFIIYFWTLIILLYIVKSYSKEIALKNTFKSIILYFQNVSKHSFPHHPLFYKSNTRI